MRIEVSAPLVMKYISPPLSQALRNSSRSVIQSGRTGSTGGAGSCVSLCGTDPGSSRAVTMMMILTFCSHTILQKSAMVLRKGPWVQMMSGSVQPP
ncbi:hypothetical protein J4Q44_G00209900 [Coregonus suidteri]|uniref:Uncharacterized protein n=1 Tax=Coregonus suidteri TaxID=861788 RepID=A0AAN8LAL9_9TELE